MVDRSDKSLLLQMLQQNDEKHEEAHRRIRADHRVLEDDVRQMRTQLNLVLGRLAEQTQSLATVKDGPIDMGKIVFAPKMVLSIIALVVAIISGNWLTTWPIRNAIQTAISEVQSKLDANARLQDERTNTLHDAIDEIRKQQQLQQLELNELNNKFATLKGARP